MLKPAHLYQEELTGKFYETWYNPEYKYYYDGDPTVPDFPTHPDGTRQFVSVDDDDNVIGYISYYCNPVLRRANNFGILSFDKGNMTFIKDCKQTILDIFLKYHLEAAEWFCYKDNPAIRLYRNFIRNYGGREVGTLRRCAKAYDGVLRDIVIFEVAREDIDINKETLTLCRKPKSYRESF